MPISPANHAAFYNRIAGAYDLIADPGEAAARRDGEAALALQPGESVLEVGFGTGNSLLTFAQQVGTSGRVCGIDISESMRKIASTRFEHAPELARIVDLQIGDARLLPYPDQQFNAVFASFTLELFDDREIPAVLSEMRRVLRRDGRLGLVVMATPENAQHDSLLEHVYVWMHQHFPHIVDCHPVNIEPLLDETGFEVASRKRIEIWTLPVDIVIAKPVGESG
ncbi:MAG: methyltransferase domain-containing protein [Planctomycetaceae bacterium]|nr:methyltransferase domain-containing protein [Planctomycetaceae bacterium]